MGDDAGAVVGERAGRGEGLLGGAVRAVAELHQRGAGDHGDRQQLRGGGPGGGGERVGAGLVGVREGAQVIQVASTPSQRLVAVLADGHEHRVDGHARGPAGVGDGDAAALDLGLTGRELGIGRAQPGGRVEAPYPVFAAFFDDHRARPQVVLDEPPLEEPEDDDVEDEDDVDDEDEPVEVSPVPVLVLVSVEVPVLVLVEVPVLLVLVASVVPVLVVLVASVVPVVLVASVVLVAPVVPVVPVALSLMLPAGWKSRLDGMSR